MSSRLTQLPLIGKPSQPPPARGASAARLFQPVDAASVVFFRVAFGAILFWEVCRYFLFGWVGRYYAEPQFRFAYYGFEWLPPWPANWMHAHFAILGVLALCIAAGFLYRISTVLFFLGFTYIFLLDQSNYLNHFYMICLIGLLMIFIPAHSISRWTPG